jgi:hypothetical protein
MPPVEVRRVPVKATFAEVAAYWPWTLADVVPALPNVPGMRSVKRSSGAGGLRAALREGCEMAEAGAEERRRADPPRRPLMAKTGGAWERTTAPQRVLRDVPPALRRARRGSA